MSERFIDQCREDARRKRERESLDYCEGEDVTGWSQEQLDRRAERLAAASPDERKETQT